MPYYFYFLFQIYEDREKEQNRGIHIVVLNQATVGCFITFRMHRDLKWSPLKLNVIGYKSIGPMLCISL